MTVANGFTNGLDRSQPLSGPTEVPAPASALQKVKELVAALEVPFDPSVVEWRVTNTTKEPPYRGQVIPYADQRAYTDRLNALFTPAGWTRKYQVHTSANFQRSKDQKITAKILVTCEMTIFGLGSHSATGEEWADDDNAATSAEAQAFKRACSCFGLGRYLYHFAGVWVDLDGRKRPKTTPILFGWATPEGWKNGLRPAPSLRDKANGSFQQPGPLVSKSGDTAFVQKIALMEEKLGKSLYRGLLKTLARVWNPDQIHDPALQERVLAYMEGADRGLRRLDAALDRVGREPLVAILKALNVKSLNQVADLEILHRIVIAMEAEAKTRFRH